MTREELKKTIEDLDAISIFLTQQVSGIANMAKVMDDTITILKTTLKDSENIILLPSMRLVKKQDHDGAQNVVPITTKKRGWPKGKPRKPKLEEVAL